MTPDIWKCSFCQWAGRWPRQRRTSHGVILKCPLCREPVIGIALNGDVLMMRESPDVSFTSIRTRRFRVLSEDSIMEKAAAQKDADREIFAAIEAAGMFGDILMTGEVADG